MNFVATKARVLNRGQPPDSFLQELVDWGKTVPMELFAPNTNPADVYASVKPVLGPWTSLEYRRGVMLEVMRVLAGFESSWNWNEGVDLSALDRSRPETQEAGAWQVSMDALAFGQDLKDLTQNVIGSSDYLSYTQEGQKILALKVQQFQAAMKSNHPFAMEFIARLLRHTCKHNGPVLRHEIDPWLSRSAVNEFWTLIATSVAA